MSALLIINNQALDLPEDFSVKLNREIADIREPEKRSGDWSKTVTIPCTSNNKKIFTHIFDLQVNIQASGGQYTYSFNPNKKADITYLHNDITQLDGFLRLIQIKETDSHEIYFECSLHGKQVDLFTTLRGRTMSELDFTQYNHALTRTNVRNSWDTSIIKNGSAYVNFSGGVPTGEGYVYPLIDYGTLPNFTYVSLREMFPALYAREVMSAIFASAGYTWTSDSFFNEEIFKRLIIPNTTGMQLSLADIEERLFAAGASANTMLQIGNTVTMNDDSTGSFYDNGGNYTASGSTFTSPVGGTYDFLFNAIGTFTPSGYSPGVIDPAGMNVNLGLYVNDVFTRNLTLAFLVGSAGTPLSFHQTLRAENIRVPEGATVKIKLQSVRDVNNNVSLVDADFGLEIATGTYWANRVSAGSWGFNQTVDFTAFFEDDAKQLDFVLGMVRMFNLYVDVDPTSDKMLIIKTRDSYYNSTVRDWTNKRDYSRELEIIPMGELDANRYYFNYKQGDDDGNKEYTAKYNGRNYGDKLFVVDNDFVKDTKKIEVPFMPTTITPINSDKKVPYISVDGNNKGGGIHVLYYKGLVSCQLWTLLNEPISNGYANYDQLTTFPYSGHLDDTTAPTIDLNFGMPFEVNLPAGVTYTNNNLFNHYWRSYIESITDINSKIVRGYFYITPADYQQLSFSDLFYFDNQFFRLNKIIDFDPSTDDITQCEFLLLQQVPAFTAETGLTGYGYNELDTYGNKFPDSIDPKFRNGGISQGGILGGGSDSNTGGGDGQLVLSKNSNANGGTSVLIAGGEEVVLPIALNNVVTLNCTSFTPATSGVFVYNQEFTQADAISDASIQEHTAGANVTINNNTSTLWVNPASPLAALAITMPSAPYEGQECLIVFGGTITSGAVVTSVSMDADVLGGSSFTTANVGDALRLKYLSSITKWIRF